MHRIVTVVQSRCLLLYRFQHLLLRFRGREMLAARQSRSGAVTSCLMDGHSCGISMCAWQHPHRHIWSERAVTFSCDAVKIILHTME